MTSLSLSFYGWVNNAVGGEGGWVGGDSSPPPKTPQGPEPSQGTSQGFSFLVNREGIPICLAYLIVGF